MKQIPGAADVGLHQVTNAPEMLVKSIARARRNSALPSATSQQPFDFAQRHIAGHTELLGRSENWNQLSGRDPDPAASGRFRGCDPSTSLAGNDPAHPQLLSNVVSLERAETPAVDQSHQRATGVRHLCQCARRRSRPRFRPGHKDRERVSPETPARKHDQRARPGRKHEHRVQQTRPRPHFRGRAHLFPDERIMGPVVRGCVSFGVVAREPEFVPLKRAQRRTTFTSLIILIVRSNSSAEAL